MVRRGRRRSSGRIPQPSGGPWCRSCRPVSRNCWYSASSRRMRGRGRQSGSAASSTGRCLSLNFPEGRVPIVYMPGIGRQELRAAEECPDALKPLVELMFRGAIWVQPNGSDWTVSAFLTSPRVLGLDIARDRASNDALQRALPEVALASIAQLTGRRLQADDFDRMLSEDVVRDILRWMGDASGTRARLGKNGWGAFRSRCREELAFESRDRSRRGRGRATRQG